MTDKEIIEGLLGVIENGLNKMSNEDLTLLRVALARVDDSERTRKGGNKRK